MALFSEFKSKGDRAFRHDDLFQAISYYTEALSLVPDDEEVLGCRSAIYSKLNMYNEAKNDAERLISAVPNEPKGYFLKAVALESLSNNTDALKSFLSAYERDPRHPLELVLSIIQVAGSICQLSEDEEIDLTQEGDNDDAKKFKILVLLGKRFHKSNNSSLSIEILMTALTSHCNLSKSTTWFQAPETKRMDNNDSQYSLASISEHLLAPTKKHCLSSMYITTGCHGDESEMTFDEEKIENSPAIDSQTIMSALATLGLSYFALNKLKQAVLYSKQCLMLALECENKKYELRSYVHLSNIHQRLGDYLQAVSYNGKLLAVGRDLEKEDRSEHEEYWNKDIERKAVWNLSAAYKSLGDFKTALKYAHEYMELIKVIDQEKLTVAYSNLGQLELLLGNHTNALEFHRIEVRLSKKFNDKESMAYAYGNVGKVYAAMKNFKQSEINHMQHMKLAQSISDRVCELVAVKQLGDMFRLMEEYGKALEQYDKHLSQVKVNKLEESLQCQVYGLIGLCYWKLNQLYRSQHNFEQCLKLATDIGDKQEELDARHFLAKIMKELRLYEKCRQYYNEVIPVLEHRLFMKQENQVIFEDELVDKLADCYGDLQEVLIEMDCVKEALEICEHWKSKLLVNILRSRDILRTDEGILHADLSPYSSAEIFKLVDSSESLVLMFSCVKSGFMSWLLAPGKGVLKFYRYKNCEHISVEERIKNCIEKLHDSHKTNYKCDQRSLPESGGRVSLQGQSSTQQESSCFVCHFSNSNFTPLQMLYKMLIEPFREELQREDKDVLSNKLMIVPDLPMNVVPFPSLQNARGEYLYKKYSVSIMPCVRALSLKDSSPRKVTTDEDFKILVAGNPKIPSVDLNGVAWQPPGEGILAEKEVTSIATLLGVEPVTGCQATKECIIETLSKSSLAHIVTYGSWKKGCLAFTPNSHCHGDRPLEDSYLLSVSDLLSIDLTAKLIVISSCCSCSHEFCYLKQVNLSLATAFLAAGAQAVMIPLWSVEQPTLMNFYHHLYCDLEKGETINYAITQAYGHIRSTDQLSNPVFWSSHTMIGFDGSFNLLKLRHQLYDQLLDREVSCVGCHRFGIRTSDTLNDKAKADRFREILTSLMLQHGSLPLVLPALRDLVKLANSMLASYEEGRSLNQIVMSSQLNSSVLDAPFSQDLLLFLGFNFQKDGAKEKDPFVVFPHWDYESTLETCAIILDAACSIFEVSGLAGHLLGRLMKILTLNNMEKMKELLNITTKYPTRIVKTSDFMVRSLWCHKEIQRFLISVGFYEVGQSLLFNKNENNQIMIKGALKIVSGLLGNLDMVKIKPHLSSTRELTSEDSRNIKLVSLSPLVTETNQIVMRTPWMSQRADLKEAKIKLKFAKELEAINKHFGRVVTRSNYWHAQLLRAQNSKRPSLPLIRTKDQQPQLPLATAETKRRLKVKVVSGLTPSCDRKLAEEEPKITITEARERRKAIYKIYGQRYDDIAMRKRNEIRHLFSSFTGD